MLELSEEKREPINSISPQLYYRRVPHSYPTYKMLVLTPENGSSFEIKPSGGGNVSFNLPKVVYNLRQSAFRVTYTPTAAPTIGTNPGYNWLYRDCLAGFRQVILSIGNGSMRMVDLDLTSYFTKIVWKAEIKGNQYNFFPKHSNGSGWGYNLRPNSTEVIGVPGVGTNAPTYGDPLSVRPDGSIATLKFFENTYCEPGAPTSATPVLNFFIPGWLFPHTLLDYDKDLYFGETMTLKIVWDTVNNVGWTNIDDVDPTATVAAVMNSPIQLSNVDYILAVENDADIIKKIEAEYNSSEGIKLMIPYVHAYSQIVNAINPVVEMTFKQSEHGRYLQKIYSSIIVGGTANKVYNNNIKDPANGITAFFTRFDGKRIQDFNIDRSKLEDYFLLQDKLQGTIIYDSSIYEYNWFWLDDFTDNKTIDNQNYDLDNSNLIKGIDLANGDKIWSIHYTGPLQTRNHLTFAICLRELTIKPGAGGISLI